MKENPDRKSFNHSASEQVVSRAMGSDPMVFFGNHCLFARFSGHSSSTEHEYNLIVDLTLLKSVT